MSEILGSYWFWFAVSFLTFGAWLYFGVEREPVDQPATAKPNEKYDPVFYDAAEASWFFWDEIGAEQFGPYTSEQRARHELECYADWLDVGPDWNVRVRGTPALFIFEFHVPGGTVEGPYASFEDAKASRDAYRRALESHSAPGMYS